MLALLTLLSAAAIAQLPAPPDFPFAREAAERYQREYAAARKLPLTLKDDLGIELILIPPGTFVMGSPETEPGRNKDERQHRVTLTKPFYLAKHETTVGQFRKFIEATKYVTDVEKAGGGNAHDEKAVWEHRPGTTWRKPGYAGPFEPRDDHPIVHISHTDARAYCEWRTKSGLKLPGLDVASPYALPSEAQWEWACRAGSGSRFWWGEQEDASGKVANVGDERLKQVQPLWPRTIMPMNDGHAFAAPVGSYRANAFGLHDMLGNVWEFCGSRFGAYPADPTTDPGDLGTQESYAVRGGGWSNIAADCRSATRQSDPIHFGHSNLGFRVMVVVP